MCSLPRAQIPGVRRPISGLTAVHTVRVRAFRLIASLPGLATPPFSSLSLIPACMGCAMASHPSLVAQRGVCRLLNCHACCPRWVSGSLGPGCLQCRRGSHRSKVLQPANGRSPFVFKLFTEDYRIVASTDGLSLDFYSVTRGPWVREGLLGRAGTTLSSFCSYNGLLA